MWIGLACAGLGWPGSETGRLRGCGWVWQWMRAWWEGWGGAERGNREEGCMGERDARKGDIDEMRDKRQQTREKREDRRGCREGAREKEQNNSNREGRKGNRAEGRDKRAEEATSIGDGAGRWRGGMGLSVAGWLTGWLACCFHCHLRKPRTQRNSIADVPLAACPHHVGLG